MTTTLLPEKTSSCPNPISLDNRRRSAATERRWTIFRRAWLISWLGVAAVLGLLALRGPTLLKTKNIEDIQVGDMVLAEDPETGVVEPHRVLQLYRNTKDHLRIVNLTGADGIIQRIETTDEHPFWVASRDEWVIAEDLQSGDDLLQADGQTAIITSTVYENHPSGVATYNFEVEGFHSYFVAAHGSTGPPVLVHNACTEPKPIDETRPVHGKATHDATAFNQAKKWEGAASTVEARFNQQLVDVNGMRIDGFRPDAQRIRITKAGNRKVDVFEVRSPGQSKEFMNAKIKAIKEALGDQAGRVWWEEPIAGSPNIYPGE